MTQKVNGCQSPVQDSPLWRSDFINCPSPSLPFAHLNLRRNPFGELPLSDWAALADVDVQECDGFLSKPWATVQFVGEKGNGKTTHLLAIRDRIPESVYVHFPEGEKTEIPVGNPLLIDEAQRMTRWQQWKVFRSGIPLVLGTHRDFTGELKRAGRRVKTVVVYERMSASRLVRIIQARIEWVRRDAGPVPQLSHETADRLLTRFGPDVRRIFYELYGIFQNLPEGCIDVEV
jgi:hypothetical protein